MAASWAFVRGAVDVLERHVPRGNRQPMLRQLAALPGQNTSTKETLRRMLTEIDERELRRLRARR